jgi:hypothetical protein
MVAILHMFTWCKYEAKLPNGHPANWYPISAGLQSVSMEFECEEEGEE